MEGEHSKRICLTAGDAGGRANVEFHPRLVELAIPPLMRCPNVAAAILGSNASAFIAPQVMTSCCKGIRRPFIAAIR
jgi:hypothetical protein